MGKNLAFITLSLLLGACASRPIEELILADVAVKAAQKVKADALAPDAFRKAENHYLRAKKDYNDGYFDSSRKYANEARVLAEQAEYKALFKQNQVKSRTTSDEDGGRGSDLGPSSEGLEP